MERPPALGQWDLDFGELSRAVIGFWLLVMGHFAIIAVYLTAPVYVLIRGLYDARRGRPRRLVRWAATTVVGAVVGGCACVLAALSAGGHVLPTQLLVCGYFSTAFVLILQGFDRLLWSVGRRIFGLKSIRPGGPGQWRAVACLIARSAVVVCVGIPYVVAACVTFRPKVIEASDPGREMRWQFQDVRFAATDSTRLVGWWIPAASGPVDQTVIVCPDWLGEKAGLLKLCRSVHADYNVLVFDPRGRGGSGGQIGGFGALETRDVLGAARWLRSTDPAAARRVFVLGVGTGGAAVLSAAADDPDIDGVAVVETFGSLDRLTRQLVPGTISGLICRAGLRMAAWQTGADLAGFRPEEAAARLWPRPLLVVHRINDEIYPFDGGRSVYDAAAEPKSRRWITPTDDPKSTSAAERKTNYRRAIDADDTGSTIKAFFDRAARVI